MHWTIRNSEMVDGMPLVFGHGGSDGTMALAFPAIDAVVLYFTQSRYHSERERFLSQLARIPPFGNFLTSEWNREIERQWTELRGDGADFERFAVPPGGLARYVGTYSGPGMEVQVLTRGDSLLYQPSKSSAVPLHPVSPHVFIGHVVCFDRLLRITFEPSEDGTIDRYRAESLDGWSGVFERQP